MYSIVSSKLSIYVQIYCINNLKLAVVEEDGIVISYSHRLEWNFLKEQMVINLSAMLLLKVRLYLIPFSTISLLYYKYHYIHGIIFSAPSF